MRKSTGNLFYPFAPIGPRASGSEGKGCGRAPVRRVSFSVVSGLPTERNLFSWLLAGTRVAMEEKTRAWLEDTCLP